MHLLCQVEIQLCSHNMIPQHPDTMITSMAIAQVHIRNIGQQLIVFTSDLQLCRVALEIQWTCTKSFKMLFYG